MTEDLFAHMNIDLRTLSPVGCLPATAEPQRAILSGYVVVAASKQGLIDGLLDRAAYVKDVRVLGQ